MMACISDSAGLIYYKTNQGGTTKEVFNFIFNLDIILGEFNPLMIMVNALGHKSLAEVFPSRDFLYLPPYSPFLNPIESSLSALKTRPKQLLKDAKDIYNHQYARRKIFDIRILYDPLQEVIVKHSQDLYVPT